MPKPALKRDKYKSTRGGYSRLLNLHCQNCHAVVAQYQKDGPGHLLRLYMDRIIAPEKLVGLEKKHLRDVPPIACDGCGSIIGMPYVYEKEQRPAWRLIPDTIVKKIKKIT